MTEARGVLDMLPLLRVLLRMYRGVLKLEVASHLIPFHVLEVHERTRNVLVEHGGSRRSCGTRQRDFVSKRRFDSALGPASCTDAFSLSGHKKNTSEQAHTQGRTRRPGLRVVERSGISIDHSLHSAAPSAESVESVAIG
jgi:hypothetical protein